MKKTAPEISFAIGIPTINQWPLLESFLPLYNMRMPNTRIYIIDNGGQYVSTKWLRHFSYERMDSNIGVAASWNRLCQKIFTDGHTHAIISNDDVFWSMPPDQLKDFLAKHPRDIYKTQRDDFSLFILPKTTFEKIGPFDLVFSPAYFEDRDYSYRMKLAGCSVHASMRFDPAIYNESLSTKKDPSLLANFKLNQQQYVDKWGGLPGYEKFTRPFNGKSEK